MRILRHFIFLFSFLTAMECASAPVYPTPPYAANKLEININSFDFSQYFSRSKKINEADFYIAQFGGGSVLLGILAGPVGTAISGSMIDAQSTQIAKSFAGETKFDLVAKLKDNLSSHTFQNNGDVENSYMLLPALLLQLSKDNKMRTSLVIRATNGKVGDQSWSDNYFYHFDYLPDASLFEEKRFDEYTSNVLKELDSAMNTLVNVAVTDLTKQSKDSPPLRVKSNFFGNFEMIRYSSLEINNHPGFSVFRIDGKPGMIFMPYVQGIHVFKSPNFETFPQ